MTFAFIIRTISPSARLSPSHSVCRILYAPSVTINRPSPKPKAAVSHLPCPDCDIKVEGFTRSHLCARLHISSQPNLISACSPAPVHPYRTRYGGGLYSAVRPSVRPSVSYYARLPSRPSLSLRYPVEYLEKKCLFGESK